MFKSYGRDSSEGTRTNSKNISGRMLKSQAQPEKKNTQKRRRLLPGKKVSICSSCEGFPSRIVQSRPFSLRPRRSPEVWKKKRGPAAQRFREY